MVCYGTLGYGMRVIVISLAAGLALALLTFLGGSFSKRFGGGLRVLLETEQGEQG